MADTIVAPQTTTPKTGTQTNQAQNLLTHIKSTSDAMDKGDVLGSAMGVTNVAMDVIGIVGDPMGAITSAGVGWVLNAVSFLREPFDILKGNPSAITGSSQSWLTAANSLTTAAEKYRTTSTTQTQSWTGSAGDGYRAASSSQADGLEALAKASQSVSSAITQAGKAVAEGRKIVMDLISEAVSKIIQICIEALSSSWLSFGASIAAGIAQSVQKAVSTAQKLVQKIQKVVQTLQKIIQFVQKVMQIVQQVKQLLDMIGGKASGVPNAQPTAAPVSYNVDSTGHDPNNVTATTPQAAPIAPGYQWQDVKNVAENGTQVGQVTPAVQPGAPVSQVPQVRGGITVETLRKIMPFLSAKKAAAYLPLLNAAMAEANINTPRRQAAFLAQVAHESGQFRYMEEIASGAKYEGRKDLGNTQPGDGVLYKGRGPIQLTGRANYEAAGQALGLDLVNNPKTVSDPSVGFRTTAWYWDSRGLNDLADAGNFREITHRINGGYNGQADREAYYAAAKKALGI
jgi:predicted chitinase/uncharacterized protein YukE